MYLLSLLGAIGIIVFNFHSLGVTSGVLVLLLCCHIVAKLYVETTRQKMYFAGDGVFFVLSIVILGHMFMEEDMTKAQSFIWSILVLLTVGSFLVWLERKPNREYLESTVDFPILNGKALKLVSIWDSRDMFMSDEDTKPTYLETIQWLSGLSILPKEVRRYLRGKNKILEALRDILVDAYVHKVDISLENKLHMIDSFGTILDKLHQFHIDLDPQGEVLRGKK